MMLGIQRYGLGIQRYGRGIQSFGLLVSAFAATLGAQTPGAEQSAPVVIENATIHTMAGRTLEKASLLFDKGKIVALGAVEVPEGATRVDASGQHVWPTMIQANSVVGLAEIGSVPATLDFRETGDVVPEVRAEVAVNPDNSWLPVTRANGIGYVLAVPASGVVSGRSALIALDGWSWEDMAVRAPVALHVRWPAMLVGGEHEAEARAKRDARLHALEELFAKARAYHAQKRGDDAPRRDARLEALGPLLSRDVAVFVHAEKLRQIEAALDWAAREKLRMVLVGARDAALVARELAARKVPVVIAGVHRLPGRRHAAFDARFTLAAKLADAGVEFCIACEGDSFSGAHDRNLPYHAATAAAYGLSPERAMQAVTRDAARICGVGDRLGTLEVGKDASLIVTSGSPLEITTQVTRMWLAGRVVDLDNRQLRLRRKYLEKHRRQRGK